MPNINIELKIKGLTDLVTEFVSRNLYLADKKSLLDQNQNDIMKDMDIIIGANYSYLLNACNALFPLQPIVIIY